MTVTPEGDRAASKRQRGPTAGQVFAAVGGTIGLLGFFGKVLDEWFLAIAATALLIALIALYKFRGFWHHGRFVTYGVLGLIAFAVVSLSLSVLELAGVTGSSGEISRADLRSAIQSSASRGCALAIRMADGDGGIYAAGLDRKNLYPDGARIVARALSGDGSIEGGVLGFRYATVAGKRRHANESAGVALPFYARPIVLSEYDALSFSLNAAAGRRPGPADVSVRLTTDDPSAADPELVVRETPPVSRVGAAVTGYWQRVTIDLAEFIRQPNPQPASGTAARRANKVAFYVDNDIVDRIGAGAIRVQDVTFLKRGRGLCP